MFEPFWRNMAYLVVKDIPTNPHLSRTMAELLHIRPQELLLLVQSHALPWLVLHRRKDVIEKIAEARQDANIHSALVDPTNWSSIAALLLVQDVEDMEAFLRSLLSSLDSHFESMTLEEFFRSEMMAMIFELFKLAAEGDDSRKAAVRPSLGFLPSFH
jgi:serine/threonine-protein kinase ATR